MLSRAHLVHRVGSCTLAVGVTALFGACAGDGTPPASSSQLAIAVAPLSLEGVSYACYDLRIDNDLEQTVWSLGTSAAEGAAPSVCSNQYGNATGGDITYVGSCDASEQDTGDGGVALNAVTLWVDGLYDASGADLGAWNNPCPWPTGCRYVVPCAENADTRVDIDLTILRAAHQGFFDIGVDFDDIFCSGKIDCTDPETGDPLRLVYDPVTRQLTPTAVVAFACSGGVDEDTRLYFSHLTVDCADTDPVVLDLSAAEGNLYSATAAAPAPLSQVTLFRDIESLVDPTTQESLGKIFQNVALGFALQGLGHSCTLSLTGTASAGSLDACTTDATATYPIVNWSLPITNVAGTAFVCDQHPLDADALAEVFTSYTTPGAPVTFATEVDGVGTSAVATSCGGGGGGGGVGTIAGRIYFDETGGFIDWVEDGAPVYRDDLDETCFNDEGSEVLCLIYYGYQPEPDWLWFEDEEYAAKGWNPVVRVVGSGGTTREVTLGATTSEFSFNDLPTDETYCVRWMNAVPAAAFSQGYRWPVEPKIPLRPTNGLVADWPAGDPIEACDLNVTEGGTTHQDIGLSYGDDAFTLDPEDEGGG